MDDELPIPPAVPRPRVIARALAAAGAFGRTPVDAVLGWRRGQRPAPSVGSLLLMAALIVAGVELLPKALSDVTLTVRARTEVLELDLQPERTYVWWLPRGSYSLLMGREAAGCEHRGGLDVACAYAEPTALTIKSGATVRFELVHGEGDMPPSFTLALTPRLRSDGSETRSSFEIGSAAEDARIVTADLLTFESAPVGQWRIPLIAERAQIGEFLSDAVAAGDSLGTSARQPIMAEGDVRMFARALWLDERYQIKEERFDPADIVQIPADTNSRGLVLGLLSLDAAAPDAFALTLHTNLAEVFVRRLGAEHRIGVSMWAIVSQMPIWLALWVVFVSLIVVANYYTSRRKSAGSSE